MDFLTLAKSRRSIRVFQDVEVPRDTVMQLIEAAQAAPSAGNRQPWHFYCVSDDALRKEIAERAYKQAFIGTAPVLIVVCADIPKTVERYGDRGRHLYCLQDTAAAIQNILLCAKSLGLGTCWIGAFDENAIAELLSLPKDMRPVAILPVGVPAAEQAMPKRRPIEEIATFL